MAKPIFCPLGHKSAARTAAFPYSYIVVGNRATLYAASQAPPGCTCTTHGVCHNPSILDRMCVVSSQLSNEEIQTQTWPRQSPPPDAILCRQFARLIRFAYACRKHLPTFCDHPSSFLSPFHLVGSQASAERHGKEAKKLMQTSILVELHAHGPWSSPTGKKKNHTRLEDVHSLPEGRPCVHLCHDLIR